jgi:hypothetical protein
MTKRQIVIGLMVALVTLAVLTAGCTSNTSNTTSPSPSNESKSALPTGTSSPTPVVVTVAVSSIPTPAPPQQRIATKIEGDKYVSVAMSPGAGIIQGQQYTFGFSIFTLPEIPGRILCGQYVNFYIDGKPAGGTWQRSELGTCFASDFLVLSPQETTKLSVGAHTLAVDYLGDNAYAPSHFGGTFYVRAS